MHFDIDNFVIKYVTHMTTGNFVDHPKWQVAKVTMLVNDIYKINVYTATGL